MANYKVDPFEKYQETQEGRDGYSSKTGFQSSADDHYEDKINFLNILFPNKPSMFHFVVEGDSMIGKGIRTGTVIIYDRSLDPKHESIVFATLNGEFTVRIYWLHQGRHFLVPANRKYKVIEITPEMDCTIEGVVTAMINYA